MTEQEIETFARELCQLWLDNLENPESLIHLIESEAEKYCESWSSRELYARLVSEVSLYLFAITGSTATARQFLDHVYQPTA